MRHLGRLGSHRVRQDHQVHDHLGVRHRVQRDELQRSLGDRDDHHEPGQWAVHRVPWLRDRQNRLERRGVHRVQRHQERQVRQRGVHRQGQSRDEVHR